ncbi:unnamed protein product [Auanema sp. JU1783]|nr:unnamed protein product [Auanema sp. JU1783]
MNYFFLISLLQIIFQFVTAEGHCYSCSGTCHNEHCNCQMGSCSSNQCFIEKKPTEEKGVFRITKGCLRRSPRTFLGCEYDNFSDHILCVCTGNFCNNNIYVRPIKQREVTCRRCSDKDPECSDTCQGQWCHEDTASGAAGCGYGPPALPFFHKGPELIPYRNKLCVTMSRGAGKPRRHCICASNMCNAYIKPTYGITLSRDGLLRSRSLGSDILPLYSCVNCEINSQDTSVTSSCKQSKCIGHFCTYTAQRHYLNSPNRGSSFQSMSEKQGCINVTDSSMVHKGCSRKWMQNEYEEVMCACEGDNCNRDEFTAIADNNLKFLTLFIPFMILYFF